jgi:uncharacterized protein YbjT (DUF2867 family)
MASSAQKRIITVLASTGNQGLSIVNAFAKDPAFHIRAATRDTTSAKAQALLALGPNITLVNASGNNPESLKDAFEGSEIVFATSVADDPMSEYEQGVCAADIAKEKNVSLFLWSYVSINVFHSLSIHK